MSPKNLAGSVANALMPHISLGESGVPHNPVELGLEDVVDVTVLLVVLDEAAALLISVLDEAAALLVSVLALLVLDEEALPLVVIALEGHI